MDDLIKNLAARFGPQSVWSGDALAKRSSDYLGDTPLKARALLRPASTCEVAEMLRLCSLAGQPVVAHGGLTNLVQDTFTTESEIALSLERMDAIEELDRVGGTMTVQAGATLRKVQEAAEATGLFFPLDLPARDHAVVGGMIGTNAGGLRVIRYGMMRELVLGLEAVLADGTVLDSLNKLLKKNAGYDLKHLFIGTEGSLGIVTRAVLRLWPRPGGAATALLAVEHFEQIEGLLALAQSRLSGQLTSFEVMWNEFYRLTTTPPSVSRPPLRSDLPYYILLESLGADPAQEQARLESMLNQAQEENLLSGLVIAGSSSQRSALWRIRDDSDQIEAQYQPTFSFDVSLPITDMEWYIGQVRSELETAFGQVKLWVFGHLADGNLHLGVWGSAICEPDHERVERIIYQPLLKVGGSVSAEHGIGLKKKPYLSFSRTGEEIAVMRRLKATLDPHGILNPGKIFDLE